MKRLSFAAALMVLLALSPMAFAQYNGGEPVSVLPVPGTNYLVVVDAGYGVHAVHVVDGPLQHNHLCL